MFFIRKKPVFRENPKKERSELIRQIEVSKTAILSAQNQFEQVVDPTLIDCYIYELNAAQLRYQFLLRDLKMRETQEVTPLSFRAPRRPKRKPPKGKTRTVPERYRSYSRFLQPADAVDLPYAEAWLYRSLHWPSV